MIKQVRRFFIFLISLFSLTGCSGVSTSQRYTSTPRAVYAINYKADTHKLSIKSINVTPSLAGQNITPFAGVFQVGNAVFNGSSVTAPVYITNNDSSDWTGVEMQAYNLLSGNSTAADTDLGTGWRIDSPVDGAWGWIFTSGTAGSQFTIAAGGQSVDKIIGFNATADFVAVVYIYANVPVISQITPAVGLIGSTVTISGYNFSTTGSLTFSGVTAVVQSWTTNSIVATVPSGITSGNVVVKTGDLNTPYSNPIVFTPYTLATVGGSPFDIARDASGNLWVPNYNDNTVTELNSTGSTIGTYPVGTQPTGIAIDASGNAWITNFADNTVTELNSSGGTIGTFPVGTSPMGIAIDASGNVWVTNNGSNTVSELNSSGSTISTYTVGSVPWDIAIDSSGNVWVTNNGGGTVSELNSSGTLITTVTVGTSPWGIAIDASGNVWVINNGDGTVTELTSSGAVIGTYNAGSGPWGIAIDASGNIWITDSNNSTLTELNSSGNLIGTYPVGNSPDGMAIDASGNIWVVNNIDNTVTKLLGLTKGPQYFPYTGPQFPGGGNF